MNVGSLRAILRLDNDQFNKGVDQSERRFGRAKKFIAAGAKAMVGAVVGIGGAMLGAAAKTASFGDEVAKSARKAGLGVEQFQELRFAFKQGGVEAATFDTAMQKFNKRLGESATSGGTADEAFESLGVSLRDADGNVRDASGAMDEVLPKLADIESDAERAAVAGDLFGQRAGPELAAALSQGMGGIDAARQKAQDMGIVMSEDATKAAEQFGDQWDDIKQQIMGFIRGAGTPVMKWMTESLFPAVQDHVIPAIQGLADWLGPKLSAAMSAMMDAFDQYLQPALQALSDWWEANGPAIQQAASDVGREVRTMAREAGSLLSEHLLPALRTLADWWKGEGPAIVTVIKSVLAAKVAFYRTAVRVITRLGEVVARVIGTIVGWFQSAGDQSGETGKRMASVWTSLREVTEAAWNAIRDVVVTVVGAVRTAVAGATAAVQWIWRRWGEDIKAFAETVFNAILRIVDGVLTAIGGVFEVFAGVFTGDWSRMWEGVKTVFAGLWDAILGVFEGTLGALRLAWTVFEDAFRAAWSAMWEWARGRLSEVLSWLGELWAETWEQSVLAKLVDVIGRLQERLGAAMQWVRETMSNVAGSVRRSWDALTSAVSSRVDAIRSKVASGIQSVVDIINRFIGGFNSIASAVGLSLSIDKIPAVDPKVVHPAMHSGGIIGEDAEQRRGPLRSNEVPFVGLRGEEVLTEDDPRHSANLDKRSIWNPQSFNKPEQTYSELKNTRSLYVDNDAPGWGIAEAASRWNAITPHLEVQAGIGSGTRGEDYSQASANAVSKSYEDYLGIMHGWLLRLNNAQGLDATRRRQVATHEIGHVLGFGHPTGVDSVMTPGRLGGSKSGITPWDKRQLRAMYPPLPGVEPGAEDEGGPGVIARTVQNITDWIGDKFGGTVAATIGQLQDLARGNPLVGLMANAGIKLARNAIPFLSDNATRDPTGGGGGGGGGKMLDRVRALLERFPSAYITSAYRTPAQNRAAGGVPNSFHLDKNNPAVDIDGPPSVLDRIAGILREQGGLRELLWRVAGHFGHLHVAHDGGQVVNGGMQPLGSDVLARLSDDETVIPPGKMPSGNDGGDLAGLMREQNRLLRKGQAILVDREVLGEVVRDEFHRLGRDNITAGVP